MTYHSWQWDVAIFCHSGWDNQHLLPYVFLSLQGFLGDLARSLGEDATLINILQALDGHYGMVMMFNALSTELHFLKQGSGENVTGFGVCLLQQVQILQSEYLARIQQKRIEEMKWDCFYNGLNPKYQWMLAHMVDDEPPARYSDLLLAAQKLERQAEARDPLLLKTTPTEGLNVTHSQTSGNLFLSQKLKGSHTLTAPSARVESNRLAEDSCMKAEEAEDAKSSDEQNPENLSGIAGADQSVGYIIHFANMVKLYQQKN